MDNPLSPTSVSHRRFSMTYKPSDDESQLALRNISDAMECWMEFIRVDPTDLIEDQPYNNIIFSISVRIIIATVFNFIQFNDEVVKAIQMTDSLQKIAHHFFKEMYFGPSQHRFLTIQNQFNSGCEQLINLLKATKTFLHFNYCLCNTINSC